MKQNFSAFVVAQIIGQLLSYISFVFLTFVVVEIVFIVLVLTLETPLLKLFLLMISYTPTLGIGGRGTFALGQAEIMQFFLFWSLIAKIAGDVAKRFIKIRIKRLYLFTAFTALHVLAFVKIGQQDSRTFLAMTIFYFMSIFSYYLYKKFAGYSEVVLKFFG